jgi:DNA-binding MarR family transcriptional regulator
MLTRMPDKTRQHDPKEEARQVTRSPEQEDRRMVLTQITARGKELLGELDRPMTELHRDQLAALTKDQLRTLIDLLTAIREGNES